MRRDACSGHKESYTISLFPFASPMNTDSSTTVSLRRLISLRVALLALITAFLVAAVFAWFGLLPMAGKIAEHQFDVARTRVEAGLAEVFIPPVSLLEMSHGWLAGQAPDLESPEAFNQLFQPLLESSKQINSVVAGTSQGQGWLLLQRADGSWRNRMTDIPLRGKQQLLIDRLPDGNTVQRWEDQDYDPRKRPWFQAALDSTNREGVSWTAPYTFFTTGAPGITASTWMRLKDGREFVLGFDLLLSNLSQTTLNASVGTHGMALIVTQDERVLALPTRPAAVIDKEWQKRVLRPVAELGIRSVTDAFAVWHSDGRQNDGIFGFDSEGVRWLASIRPYQLSNQYFWTVTLAPASDFAPVWTPVVSAVSAALALVLGLTIWLARRETSRLTRPLEVLAEMNARVGRLDFHSDKPLSSRVTEIRQLAGAQEVMLGMLRSNQQELTEQASKLRQQNEVLSVLVEHFPGGISMFDSDLRLTVRNAQFRHLLALPDELLEKPDVNFEDIIRHNALRGDYGPSDPEQHVTESVARARQFQPHQIEHSTDAGKTIEIRGRPLPGGGFVASYMDITERKRAEMKLYLAASVFSHALEGIMITTADGVIIDINESFSRITGYSREEVIGHNPRMLKSGHQTPEFYAQMWNDLKEKGHWYGEIWNRRKSGETYAEMKNISAVRDAKGKVQHYVALFSDISPLKAHQKQLEHIAHYDPLTNLPNRILLADRLHQGLVQAQRRGQLLALVYLDLDGFKAINDRHGHQAGDHLLISVADAMKQALREGDTLARLGGDEFVAVLGDLADIASSVPILTRLLAAAAEPTRVGEFLLQVSASLGVTFYPQAQEIDAEQLLRQADQAMYQAKLAGKNRYHVFDIEYDSSVRGHHESVDRIRKALQQNEFVLHYQPKVNMRTGVVVGVEALIRWQHPEQGLLPPLSFLPVIEDHPLAVDVGEWVIGEALTQRARWQADGLDIQVSVNVGARQLQRVDFVERLRSILATHPGTRHGDLELEVLETSALQDLESVSRVIEDCREIGIGFALDDFGTGYSSLTYLKNLRVGLIKIDRSFVRDMLHDADDLSILEGVLGLATAFRRQVIAEGVETVAQGALLLQLGCELGQGFGIARPMPGPDMVAWSQAWRSNQPWIRPPAAMS